MKFEVDAALKAHSEWRKYFRDYLLGKVAADPSTFGDSHRCHFGDWLDNEGRRLMTGVRRDEIHVAHSDFHKTAAEVIQKIKDKRFDEARADIGPDGALSLASARLTELLLKVRLHES